MTPIVKLLTVMGGRPTLASILAPVFAGGAAGLWLDPSDSATVWQDSAKTTAGVVGQPVGYRSGKAGNVAGVLQATAGARPTWNLTSGIYSDAFVAASSQGYASAAFLAGALTSNMDCFIALKRAGASKCALIYGDGSHYFGVYDSAGGAATTSAASGTPTNYVNGVAVPGGAGTTRVQLDTAIAVGSWAVLEVRNLDLSAWTALGTNQFAGFFLDGNIGGVVLCPAQTDSIRARIRRSLARKVGASVV